MEMLPAEMEWTLGLFFLGVWICASVAYYWGILGRMEQIMDVLVPLGAKSDDLAFRPILDMALRLAPIVGLPVAFRAWRWTRRMAIRSIFGAF